MTNNLFRNVIAKSSGLTSVNLGRGAYGPQQELIVLKRYGLAYQPRVVVWQLFEGNDLTDANIFADWKKNPEQSISLSERYFSNSFLAQWLSKTRFKDPDVPWLHCGIAMEQHKGLLFSTAYEPSQPANIPVGFAETMQAIEEGQRLCQSRGIQLIVVLVPTMVRVLEPDISFDRVEDQLRYLPEGVRDSERPQ